MRNSNNEDGNSNGSSSSSVASKGSNLLNYALIGGGVLLAVSALSGPKAGRVKLSAEDYNFLNSNGPTALSTLMSNDTSPIFYTTPGNTPRTEQQTAALLAALNERYVTNAAVGNLNFPANLFGEAMLTLLDIENVDLRTQSLDLYVKMFALYTNLFLGTVSAMALGVAQITQAAGQAINDATECTEWTWAKKTDYSIEQESTSNTTINTKSTATKVLFGILGSGNSVSTMHSTFQTQSLKERKTVEFFPHCTSTQINLTAVEAILIAQGAALKTVYDPLRAVVSLAPVIPKNIGARIAATVIIELDGETSRISS